MKEYEKSLLRRLIKMYGDYQASIFYKSIRDQEVTNEDIDKCKEVRETGFNLNSLI